MGAKLPFLPRRHLCMIMRVGNVAPTPIYVSKAPYDKMEVSVLATRFRYIARAVIVPLGKINQDVPESLSVVLVDKDNILGQLPLPNDRDHMIVPPTAQEFCSCCNEFWWVSTYVAKGLWRRQLPYANYMMEHPVRDMLTLMLKWHIGTQTDFSVNVGACDIRCSQCLNFLKRLQ